MSNRKPAVVSPHATCYSLLVTRYSLLITRYFSDRECGCFQIGRLRTEEAAERRIDILLRADDERHEFRVRDLLERAHQCAVIRVPPLPDLAIAKQRGDSEHLL